MSAQTETPTLFDASRGEYLKTVGIDTAEAHADPAWFRAALVVARQVCTDNETFSTDHLWARLSASRIEVPHEPRVLGAVMRRLKKLGWAVPTDRTRMSDRPECHRRPVRIWKSLLV